MHLQQQKNPIFIQWKWKKNGTDCRIYCSTYIAKITENDTFGIE